MCFLEHVSGQEPLNVGVDDHWPSHVTNMIVGNHSITSVRLEYFISINLLQVRLNSNRFNFTCVTTVKLVIKVGREGQ